jgi:hypothetical protein
MRLHVEQAERLIVHYKGTGRKSFVPKSMAAAQAAELEVDRSGIDSCLKALLSKERGREMWPCAIDRHLRVVRFDSCCRMIRLRTPNLARSVVDRKEILVAAHAKTTEAYVAEMVS